MFEIVERFKEDKSLSLADLISEYVTSVLILNL
jgi:hypothetical protein